MSLSKLNDARNANFRMIDPAIDWASEQATFERLAYQPAMRAAQRAFKHFPPQKQDDAIGEFMAKMWDQWRHYRENGKDPSTMVYPFIKWAKLWVSYDRKIAGRARSFDVQDYRAGMTDNTIDRHGVLKPRDRSARTNLFLDWNASSKSDNPSKLACELEQFNISLSQWYDV
jgi:hypothetical protein